MLRRSRQRLSACLTLAALLALLAVGWMPTPVAAQSLAAAPGLTSPAFLADGAHLGPGWSLRLAALGRGDMLTAVDVVTPTDDGTRVAYVHGDVTEWYLRAGEQGGGIEQGITLATAPVGDGPLTLTIATPGAAVLVHEAGTKSNGVAIAFPAVVRSATVTITAFAVYDAAPAGNLRYHGDLGASKVINPGDTVTFPIGSITVTED